MAHGSGCPAFVVALAEERMNDPVLWPVLAAIASGLSCYAVFHIAAVLIERRQHRLRSAHLRGRLHG